MPVTTYELYTPTDLVFAGNTVALVGGYTGDNDVILTVDDDDDVLNGDRFRNEDGNDTNQFGTAVLADGTVIGGPAVTVYSEQQFALTAPGEDPITLYQIEIDSNPASTSGNGILVGYLPSVPLKPGVTYTFSTSNTVATNAPDYPTIDGAICFTAESMIDTEAGPCRAGALTPGTMIRTRDNGYQPLRWIARRKLDCCDLEQAPALRPILFEPHALGPLQPERKMRLSPQHRVLVNTAANELLFGTGTVLAPAKGLTNGTTIRVDETAEEVEYIHLMFDDHQIIFADGLEAESFVPGAWALRVLPQAAREEFNALFPQFSLDGAPDNYSAYPAISVREAALLEPRARCTDQSASHRV
ncbi:Hint domain-containing protein [Ruegeria sp. 2012CJ41-6]|uniref:Hint domain-containing protein n=1 Tax=Ruegeria spongiae TaxID=2942209 RepID=A0ABT0Q374_9RHOB|nr:Hint domain-containing protein [Ruegeria spongiae]MCL6284280.1 Hint domain-containing protein [Ruegeria spongiae]